MSRGAFILGSYLFPQEVGTGKIEILGKYAEASFDRGVTAADIYYTQKTSEANLNYVIKEFNARITDVLHEQEIFRCEARCLAGRTWPADPDVNRSPTE